MWCRQCFRAASTPFRHAPRLLLARPLASTTRHSSVHAPERDSVDGGTRRSAARLLEAPVRRPQLNRYKPPQPVPSPDAPGSPPMLHPPHLPRDASIWDGAVLLVDKPPGWTSFDVCAKLRSSIARVVGKAPRKIKVLGDGLLHGAAWKRCRAWLGPCSPDRRTCPAPPSPPPSPPGARAGASPSALQHFPDRPALVPPSAAGGTFWHAGPPGLWPAGHLRGVDHQAGSRVHRRRQGLLRGHALGREHALPGRGYPCGPVQALGPRDG